MHRIEYISNSSSFSSSSFLLLPKTASPSSSLAVILQLVLYGDRRWLEFVVDAKLFMFVLPGDVSPHRVVPRERPRAVRTVHPDALVPLPDVRSQVRLVAVQSLAERTL